MFAKRSARALALLLALPSAAFALGLGDIRLLSPLNAPLDAEIDLVDVAPDEANTVQVQLASRETFARYGLDWPGYLSGVQLKTVRGGDGRELIKIRSLDPISEPFVTMLVEVNWSRGRLVREYTMLLDPPVYTPGESAVASAPVAAPSTGTGAREGAIARPTPAPAPAPQLAQSAPAENVPESAPPVPAPPPARAAREAAEGAGTSHTVERGETLSQIASGVAGEKASSAHTRSWMLAIYQANPQAFRQNMNVLRRGAVLRIPEESAAAAVSPAEANAEIRRQYAAWRSSTPAPQTAANEPGRLKLVTPSEKEPVAANATPPGPAKAQGSGTAATQAQESESKRLLELKNEELARMQQQAAKTPPPAAAPPAPAAAPPPANEAPPEATPAPSAEATAPPEQAPPPVAEPKPAPLPATAVKRPPAAPARSLTDTLLSLWWILALLALAVVGVLVARVLRARRTSEFDDSLGRLAATGADSDISMSANRAFAPEPAATPRPSPVPVTPGPLPESAFLVEETGSHERLRLSSTGNVPVMAPPKHVASDETISSETAINLDQGDPLAEADFHMAYGLYDQAADLIRIAISREPARRDLKLKLLEVFFVWGNKEQFLQTARELAESRDAASPGEWEKILIMGKQLAPEDPLFSGGGAIAGATAGGVDLDLEGGQSRVDFELLGEPPGTETPGGVDLDIGSAVGDLGATSESQSGITDRNLAINDQTTRQITQRVKPGSGTTAEMEGPTVEQPALGGEHQPTIRQKLEHAMRQSGSADHTAELALDDLGLDVGPDTIDQPGIAAPATSNSETPTLVAGMDDHSRRVMEDAHRRARDETGTSQSPSSTGAWQFDQNELEAALTQTSMAMPDSSATSRLRALSGDNVDVDVGAATDTHRAMH
ncbi:MAG: hypothetical protein JO341_05515, partial [Gammaproteobacteria bacterium]|nr:hypothetical protein [Gammaproteobacteria bacterium]